MKTVVLSVNQTVESFDKAALDSAVQIAQTKLNQLGIKDFETVSLEFTIGPTAVAISVDSVPEPEPTPEPEA